VNGNTVPNWRETLICEKCGMRNRMRGSLHVLFQEFLPEKNSKIYITEQLTIAYRWLRGRFNNVTGSEFINNNIISGTTIRSIRHENIERISFSDESFDLVLSFDILEHVADIDAAIFEIHRILAPGGRLFMTAPTNLNAEATLVRASLTSDGIIEHYEEPEYHGNPADPSGGSLCFRHFGWDFLDILREKGFIEPEILLWWDAKFGYLQSPQFAITAVRPGT
jgi:SAM-dependent methyltransferase